MNSPPMAELVKLLAALAVEDFIAEAEAKPASNVDLHSVQENVQQ